MSYYQNPQIIHHLKKNIFRKKDIIEPIHKPYVDNFMDAIGEYSNYNPDSYHSLQSTLAHILQLEVDITIGVQNCKHNFEVVDDLSRKCLNHLHSIIYTLPLSSATENKFKNAQEQLRKILFDIKKNLLTKCNDPHLYVDMLPDHQENSQYDVWI